MVNAIRDMTKKASPIPVTNRAAKSYPRFIARPETTVNVEKQRIPKSTGRFLPNRSDSKPAIIGVIMYPQRDADPTIPRVVLLTEKSCMSGGMRGPKTHRCVK
jgi:hypothetical protein